MRTFVSDLVLAMTPVFNHYFLSFISTQEFESSRSYRGVLDTTLCDKVCQ
jgi:hypothetical protein